MARAGKSRTAKAANCFYRAAKISEYQFKRVLWAFVLDEPVAEATKHIALSANSINAIYTRLRTFFTELGVFQDIYQGGDPKNGTAYGEAFEFFEHALLGFHLQRVSDKRRMKGTPMGEVDYRWCESHWRFHYMVLSEGRPSDSIYRMMYAHLLAHIRLSGPVGQSPRQLEASARLVRQQEQQRLLWLERNSIKFRSPEERQALRQLREDADP